MKKGGLAGSPRASWSSCCVPPSSARSPAEGRSRMSEVGSELQDAPEEIRHDDGPDLGPLALLNVSCPGSTSMTGPAARRGRVAAGHRALKFLAIFVTNSTSFMIRWPASTIRSTPHRRPRADGLTPTRCCGIHDQVRDQERRHAEQFTRVVSPGCASTASGSSAATSRAPPRGDRASLPGADLPGADAARRRCRPSVPVYLESVPEPDLRLHDPDSIRGLRRVKVPKEVCRGSSRSRRHVHPARGHHRPTLDVLFPGMQIMTMTSSASPGTPTSRSTTRRRPLQACRG